MSIQTVGPGGLAGALGVGGGAKIGDLAATGAPIQDEVGLGLLLLVIGYVLYFGLRRRHEQPS